MRKGRTFLSIITTAFAVSCCFSCNKPDPKPEPLKESTTTVVAKNVEADDVIKFEYKGEDDFTVDWGDQSTIDEHNTSHTYNTAISELTVTITGTFSEITFADEEGTPFASNAEVIESVELGEGIITIPDYGFYNYNALRSVIIPKSVRTIGTYTFGSASNILTIYCRAESKPASWNDNWYNYTPYFFDYVSLNTEDNTYDYVVTHKGAVISDYKGQLQEVNIPSQIHELNVVGVGSNAFFNNNNITKVKILNTVEFISYRAFSHCSLLTNVELPQNLKTLDAYAFSGSGLTSITLPDSLESIGNNAFSGCKNLSSIILPDNLLSIGDMAFYECVKFEEIVIPNSVKKMGYRVFGALLNLSIYCEAESKPKGWDDDWNYDNKPCYWGYVDRGTEGDYEYIVTSKGATILKYVGSSSSTNTNIVIPEQLGGANVVCIGKEVFASLGNIEVVTLPETVKTIEEKAFYHCAGLKSINIQNVTTIGDAAFRSTGIKNVTLSEQLLKIGKEVFCLCDYLTKITLPSKLVSIGDSAFDGCETLEEIVIPKTVTSMGGYVFDQCFSLTIYCEAKSQPTGWRNWNPRERPCYWDHIAHGDNEGVRYFVNSKKASVIGYVGDSDSIEVLDKFEGADVVVIEDEAFKGSSTKSVSLPNTLKSIGREAFAGCNSLTQINLPQGLESIGERAFLSCVNLAKIIIPESTKIISGEAFHSCYNLCIFCEAEMQPTGWDENWNPNLCPCYFDYVDDDITDEGIEYVLTTKGIIAFGYLGTGLDVRIPNNIDGVEVIGIGDKAFEDNSFNYIDLPNTIRSIGESAFKGFGQLIVDLRNFTDWFGDIPVAAIDAFAGSTCQSLVKSKNMAIAFSSEGGGWPTDLNKYEW